MSKTTFPADYSTREHLSVFETQKAIEAVKDIFSGKLKNALNLTRVSSPLFVDT